MLNKSTNRLLAEVAGLVETIGLFILLATAVLIQFYLKELPCPLCLLQRIGFFGIAISMCLNLHFGYRTSHIGFSLLFAVFTSFVALRQIELHVVPGTGSYGNAIFGMHLYTWSFLISLGAVIYNALVLILDLTPTYRYQLGKFWTGFNRIVVIFVALLILINLVLTYMECGFGFCPDNPTVYLDPL
jgi:disulfide bond formation protein DsbB